VVGVLGRWSFVAVGIVAEDVDDEVHDLLILFGEFL
jgi:hypothetical protein